MSIIKAFFVLYILSYNLINVEDHFFISKNKEGDEMKKLFFIFTLLISVLFNNSFCIAANNAICKENKERICREYDGFLDFFFNERKKSLSYDFVKIHQEPVTCDGSKNDPLSPDFWE